MALQNKFDELEKLGVFKRQKDINACVEYLNPPLLVKKSNGGYRLITAFADVGRYSKPRPSLIPDVDTTLGQIAQWRHIITTDVTSIFYQIPLARESMKYCGVATPFCGVRVYTRSAISMPGSQTKLLWRNSCVVYLELMPRSLTIYPAEPTHQRSYCTIWKRVLLALSKCNLKLSASNIVINPKSTVMLGWIWDSGPSRPPLAVLQP